MSPDVADAVERLPYAFDPRPGDRIRGDVYLPHAARESVALVVLHGFKGFKDWGFFPWVSRRLAGRLGTLTTAFNVSGSGIGEDLERFTELEAFGHNTFSREVADLEAVLDALADGRLGDLEVPSADTFGLLGHSRGGAIVLLAAERRPSVAAVATWGSIASPARYVEAWGEQLERSGVVGVRNARTGQSLPLYRDLLDDLRENREALDPERAAGRIEAPLLVVHGTEDESVAPEDAERLARAAGRRATLVRIQDAGHTFGAAHPFEGPTPALERAVDETVAHFERTLRGAGAAA